MTAVAATASPAMRTSRSASRAWIGATSSWSARSNCWPVATKRVLVVVARPPCTSSQGSTPGWPPISRSGRCPTGRRRRPRRRRPRRPAPSGCGPRCRRRRQRHLALHRQDGDRRLGAHPLDPAIDVAVQHGVADHQHVPRFNWRTASSRTAEMDQRTRTGRAGTGCGRGSVHRSAVAQSRVQAQGTHLNSNRMGSHGESMTQD